MLMLPKLEYVRDKKYLRQLGEMGCICRGCGRPSVAHHIRRLASRGGAGMGIKPSDDHTLPLCQLHHTDVHDKWGNEDAFWEGHGIYDSIALALALYAARRDPMLMFKMWKGRAVLS